MIIPPDQLDPETLDLLIEEFVTRDGAVHGHQDQALEKQIASVRKQIKAGLALIIYDEADESCSIILKDQYRPPAE